MQIPFMETTFFENVKMPLLLKASHGNVVLMTSIVVETRDMVNKSLFLRNGVSTLDNFSLSDYLIFSYGEGLNYRLSIMIYLV